MTFISVADRDGQNRDEYLGSYFQKLRNNFLGFGFLGENTYLGWDADAYPGSGNLFNPGWKKFGSGINIPNPQHCRLGRRKHAVQWTDWENRKRRGGKVVEVLK